MASNLPIFEFSDVSVQRDGKNIIEVKKLEIYPGQNLVVIGLNGAGKSTILNVLSTDIYPTKGQVNILGETIGKVDINELKNRIGFSSPKLIPRVPSQETVTNIVLSAAYSVFGRYKEIYEDFDIQRAVECLEIMGMKDLADRSFETLSDGEKQRSLIARALMNDPEILLLDEPASSLDIVAREELLARLDDVMSQPSSPAIVMVTHHLEEIPKLISHCAIVKNGQVLSFGPIDEVLTDQNLSVGYNMNLKIVNNQGRKFAYKA